ncbi:MAG: oligosaccharide flippase family protein [Flavobacteriaceae bacterium]
MTKLLAARASAWTALGNSGQQILSFLIFVYLARVLSPAEFGLMALAAALIDLLTVFGRFGQVEALMQRGEVGEAPCSTSFWLIVAIGALLLLGVLALARPFADIFGEPEVATLLFILAPVPLLQNLGQVHEAFMRSAFGYRGLAARNAGATLISGAASVAVAAGGYGIYALVAQKLIFAIAYSALVWASWRWRPSIAFDMAEARRLLKVGFDIVLANLLNMLNPRIVDLMVGWFLGVVTLGYLRIAWRIFDLAHQLVIQPVSAVSMTSLTRPGSGRPMLAPRLTRYLGTLALVAIPAIAGMGLLADDVIRLAAGAQWGPSAPMLALLAIAGAALPVNFLFPPAMVAADRTDLIGKLALLQLVVTVVSMAISVRFGIHVVLMVHVARVYLFAAINILVLRSALGLGVPTVLGCLAPPVLSSVAMVAAVRLLEHDALRAVHPLVDIAAVCVLGAGVYGAVLLGGGVAGLWRDYLLDKIQLIRDIARPASVRPGGE